MTDLEAIGRIRKLERTINDYGLRHQYMPLEQDEIRLIELLPGEGRSFLLGNISHHKLSSADLPKYYALSYCWGSIKLDHAIYTPGVLAITESLHDALQSLRETKRIGEFGEGPLYIWADAICIDQDNIPERNTQVLEIRRVYEKAYCVVIYLGEEADGSRIVYDALLKIEKSWPIKEPEEGSKVDIPFEWTLEEWKAFRCFVRRPWFTRLWVIQEVVSNKKSLAICGDWVASFSYIVQLALKCLEQTNIHEVEEDKDAKMLTKQGLQHIEMISGVTQSLLDKEPRILLTLLSKFRHCQSLLAVDHLYALLGLSEENAKAASDLAPDYSIPLPEVTKRYVGFLIQQGQVYELLQQIDSQSWMKGMPTWYPNWYDNTTNLSWLASESGRPIPGGKRHYLAGGSVTQMRVQEGKDLDLLGLWGVVFDMIDEVGDDLRTVPVRNHDYIEHNDRATLKLVAAQCHNLIMLMRGKQCIYTDSKNIEEAIVGTLLAGTEPVSPLEPNHFVKLWGEVFAVGACYKKYLEMDSDEERESAHFYSLSDQVFVDIVVRLASYLRLCRTTVGYLGQVPHGARSGDCIALFEGRPVPFVLRQAEDLPMGAWRVVGACYVHGVMDGRLWDAIEAQYPGGGRVGRINLV